MKRIVFTLVFVYSLTLVYGQDSWIQRADFTTVRYGMAAISTGAKAYAGLGYQPGGGGAKADWWEFDPAANSWTQKANFPGGARSAINGFAVNGKVYVGLGSGFDYMKDLWEYDPATDAWERKADLPGLARKSFVAFSVNGKGYVGMGKRGNNDYSSDLYEYDPVSDTWTQKASFPGNGLEAPLSFVIGEYAYVGFGTGDATTGSFYRYHPATDTWDPMSLFGIPPRFAAAGFSIGNKGYVGTGYVIQNGSPSLYQQDFYEYDPDLDMWTAKNNFGGPGRIQGGGFAIGNKGYIGMGYSGTNYKDLWEYTPGTISPVIAPHLLSSEDLPYPNPSEKFVYLPLNDGKESQVFIHDATGMLIETARIGTDNKLDVDRLKGGIYLIRHQLSEKTLMYKLFKK